MSSIDLGGLSGVYSDYSALTSDSLKNDKIRNATGSVGKDSTDEELMDACKQFESYFLEQVFKEMWKTTELGDEEQNSSSEKLVDFFGENMIQELASESTEKNSLGLAQMLYEQMKRNYGVDADSLS